MYRLADVTSPYFRSLETKPWTSVRVPGYGLLSAEPVDGDDSFPPAIAGYDVVDGWLVYEGRNGSEGVIVGTEAEIQKWMRDVDREVEERPSTAPVPYDPRVHGGGDLAKKVTDIAKRLERQYGVQAEVRLWYEEGGGLVGGDAGGGVINVANPHSTDINEVAGVRLRTPEQIVAHEIGHLVFTKNPNRQAIEELDALKERVSLYHAFEGSFEGLMDAFSVFVLAPEELQRSRPDVYAIVDRWLNGSTREAVAPAAIVYQGAVYVADAHDILTQYITAFFETFLYTHGEDPEDVARDAARVAGKHAARIGMEREDLVRWLQAAYGSVWVRKLNLNPHLDLKDVRKLALQAFDKAAQ